MVTVTQSWDDGVVDDIRLIGILRKHGAKATFNLNPGLHDDHARGHGWEYKGKEVLRLARDEMRDLYRGFEVANHTVTHPWPTRIPADKLEGELAEGRRLLEEFFQVPVRGLAYPFGDHNAAVHEAVRRTGHVYARTCTPAAAVFPPADPMQFHPSLHFLSPQFWPEFERVKVAGGVFYFWGHSYELLDEPMWAAFDQTIARLSADPAVQWKTNLELFLPA
jgi:peptidoglycan-N-acetylglucosamine deacetylase